MILDTFLLDKVYTPAVHFVDRWLHLNKYRQAWFLMSFVAIQVIIGFVRDFMLHELQHWIFYFLFCVTMFFYVILTNELSRLGDSYERAPHQMLKLRWCNSGWGFRIFCVGMAGIGSLSFPMHFSVWNVVYEAGQVAFASSWYTVQVRHPNKPRVSYSFGHTHAHQL